MKEGPEETLEGPGEALRKPRGGPGLRAECCNRSATEARGGPWEDPGRAVCIYVGRILVVFFRRVAIWVCFFSRNPKGHALLSSKGSSSNLSRLMR